MRISLRSHAAAWQDALPIGNGRTGALVFGGVVQDRIILNHHCCWLPYGNVADLPADLTNQLPEIRQMILAGRAQEAEEQWLRTCKNLAIPYVGTDSPHPAAGLRIAVQPTTEVLGFRRWLETSTGICGSDWRDEAEEIWHRRSWVDRVHDVFVYTGAYPRAIDAHVSFDTVGADLAELWRATTYPPLDAAGWAGSSLPIRDCVSFRQWSEGEQHWLEGRYLDGPGGWLVGVHVPGGSWHTGDCRLSGIEQLRVFAVVSASTETIPEYEAANQRLLNAVADADVVTAQQHSAITTELFDRCSFSLGRANAYADNESLLAAALDGPIPDGLWNRAWAMGRGVGIASSRVDGAFPPHLQGIWTGTWSPPWFGCYTNDENVQMMHWQYASGQLPELMQPLRGLIQRSLPHWRQNARNLFGCAGILAPLQQGGRNAQHLQAEWHGWTGGAGWLSRHLVDLWLLTQDDDLARQEVLPLLQEILQFYRDFLQTGEDGLLHAIPSVSVENTPPDWHSRWTVDATMEIAIIREVLTHAELLSTATGQRLESFWHSFRDKLPRYRVNEDGALAEWIYPSHRDQYQHRHLSHIYPLFPGNEFEPSQTDHRDAVARAVAARSGIGMRSQTGWSYAHMAHIHARLGDGAGVQRCLERLLRSCMQANLLTVHDDWRGQGTTLGQGERERGTLQLDALFGLTSAMQECLMQSSPQHLALGPAIPPAWRQGEITGLSSLCGALVSISWHDSQAQAEIVARRDMDVLCYVGGLAPEAAQPLQLRQGEKWHTAWQLSS